jgi:aminocarboxymuconate-semialdehyde decarboxylase
MVDQTIALDVHAHQIPIVPDRLDAIADVVLRDGVLEIDGHPVRIAQLYEPEALVAWMERHGVGRALVSAPPPTYRPQLDAAAARLWTTYLNDGLQALCGARVDRLTPALHLPTNNPEIAIETAQRAADAGARYFSMPAQPAGDLAFSDPVFEPLWLALDRLEAFVFVHPGACCDGRLKAFYLENLLGNPYETAVAAAHLVFGGVLDRFPRIRFCLAHGGGATAAMAGRWQRGFDTARPGIDPGRTPPRAALSRFFVDSIVHDDDALRLVAAVFGPDKIVFGSDWPFPMGLPDPADLPKGSADDLRRLILSGNAVPLLGGLVL